MKLASVVLNPTGFLVTTGLCLLGVMTGLKTGLVVTAGLFRLGVVMTDWVFVCETNCFFRN